MIQLQEVTKVYRTTNGPVSALAGINLRVEKGEFVAVRGPSGCGKSTLLTVVGGLGQPTSGSVVVAGEDIVRMTSGQRARFRAERIGFIFQMFHLLPYLTVIENVAAAALSRRKTDARDRAEHLLRAFGLGDRLAHRPAELSTGQCQRVAIARAMINQPDLILADEPTGNLDAASSEGVLDLLSSFHRDGGTVLLVSHQESAARYAQRTICLREGLIESN
jgi:ABC-type lipoprotein export system ATPase subunit